MPDNEHDHGDAESLARKLRSLESQLTTRERRLLRSALAAAALSGIALGGAGTASGPATDTVDSAGSSAATQTAEDIGSIRAQFVDAFTPGEEWIAAGGPDVGLPH